MLCGKSSLLFALLPAECLLTQSSKLENHAGERFGHLPPGFNRPPAPGGPGNHHRPGDHHNRNRPPGDFGDGFDGDSHHHHHHHHRPNHHYPNQNHHHHSHHHPEQAFHSNAGPNGPFGSGGGNDQSPWRRRPFHRPDRGSSSDYMDGGSFAKLYVGFISRTATEQDIRNLFEEYGHIVEIVILKDKITGQQHGSCFVKYPTTEEADRAIKTLHNQYTFPGEGVPLKIRYADGKRERYGTHHQQQQQQHTRPYMTEAVGHKLYVNGLNKEASKKEVEEIFSPYGIVEDIYILRDERKQSRGFGFIEYSHRDMAMAAISALHGTFVMSGCDLPLIVRFAEPKKPKTSETRSTLTSNFGNPLDQHAVHNNSYLQTSTNLQQEDVSQWKNQPSAAPQMPSQESHVVPDKQAQLQPIHSSTENCEQQQESKINAMQQPSEIGCKAQAVLVADTSPTTAVPEVALLDLEDCDWSEHICPDGHRYYYNCITRESKWEKPEEFRLFEQNFRKWQQSKKPSGEQPKSLTKSHSHSSEENPQSLEMLLQSEALHSQSQLQQTFAPPECMQGQAAATADIGATRV